MKRVISLLLAVVLACSLVLSASAAPVGEDYAKKLQALDLFQGTNTGFDLDKSLTRTQGVVMIIRLLGVEKSVLAGSYQHPFTDLKNYPWADNYVGYAYENGITKGVSNSVFGYGNPMTEAMFLTMVLRVLGYRDQDDGSADFVWSDPFALAVDIGLAGTNRADPFLRGDMVQICWNALNTPVKGSEFNLSKKLVDSGVFTEAKLTELGGKIKTESASSQTTQGTTAGGTTGGDTTGGSTGGGTTGGGTTGGGTVTPPPPPSIITVSSVQLSKKSMTVYVGKTGTLTCTVLPENAADKTITWTSSDPKVATVQNGVVTGVTEGTAIITASAAGGASATCSVIVIKELPTGTNETPRIPI